MAGQVSLTCDEFLDLAAVVVLDAGDADDLRRVEEHAAACPDCGARLDELRVVASVLGSAVPQVEPSPELRGRVIEAVRHAPRPFAIVRRMWPRAVRRTRISAAWV